MLAGSRDPAHTSFTQAGNVLVYVVGIVAWTRTFRDSWIQGLN